mmetsp:Transcript_4690/g.4832  ORF Transcript_4690/g.4832 Transcript_4690/m.4832 type:complete len:619 (-) Transcript_4690:573-2429(-)|eukprot:CAMPEP_0119046024 /NCGR_PEP_ID=MMETSP1177-20130426/43916_1 /TAXON_ID=2985 /ORGANISM="Ochromonas sp, Strain CCMP1899" /LENGTH=618 /DNA_ID=CAMNT_0007018609 /DNA_START=167 /DNA_END=2023 /DNA_ORIENTATION=-
MKLDDNIISYSEKKKMNSSYDNTSHGNTFNNETIELVEALRTESDNPPLSAKKGKSSSADLLDKDFYKRLNWIDDMFEILFHIRERDTTVRAEIYYGFIHFVSCLYVLAVIPQQLVLAGYDGTISVVITALCCGFGSLIGGLFMNLPFIVAPPTVVSIYLVVFLQEKQLGVEYGNAAVMLSGFFLLFLGYKPLSQFIGTLIPLPIQVGTTVGIGLLTALAGATEVDLITKGRYQLLQKGEISVEQIISISGLVIISVAIHYHMKAAFCFGLISCTLVWWLYDKTWPKAVGSMPTFQRTNLAGFTTNSTPLLTGDLVFLYILYLSGIKTSLSNLAGLTRGNGEIPRGRWIFIISGIITMISGYFNGPPILISPESAAGIKAGAKTGLSAVICGLLFLVSMFMSPIFQQVPHAGTSPVLLVIGTMLFQNVNRIDWSDIKDAAPAFCVLFFIPFMYSVVEGVLMGYYTYLLIGLFTGDLMQSCIGIVKDYRPALLESFQNKGWFLKRSNSLQRPRSDSQAGFILNAFREGRGRARSMSNARVRANSVSHNVVRSARNSVCIPTTKEEGDEEGEEDSGPPVYDPSYQYDGGFDSTYDPTLAAIEEDEEDKKAMRSLDFAVFD